MNGDRNVTPGAIAIGAVVIIGVAVAVTGSWVLGTVLGVLVLAGRPWNRRPGP